MAMECIKNCCKSFLGKGTEIEQQVITVKMPPARAISGGSRKSLGVTEDYLLSKLPPGGKEVPFVLPTFKPSYIQPRGSRYLGYQPPGLPGLHSSVRSTYAERKAELSGVSHIVYNPDSSPNMSPGTTRHSTLKNSPRGSGSGGNMKTERLTLSKSMFDLSNSSPHGHIQRYDSVSSVRSSSASSSQRDSLENSRSLESITLSGDEREQRELGKVCVRLSYQEALEQVWITLLQCKDVYLAQDSSEQQKIGFKGIITMTKPVQFKSSVKEGSPDTVFMETFVFALRLQQLRCSALVLRLQTHHPRKRTVAECVLSLRQLGPEETQHWMELSPPSKTPVCHAELHLATCFQPVNGCIQLQVLAAQNLPAPLRQAFFVKIEMQQLGRVVMEKKTHALKSSGGQLTWTESFYFPLAQDQSFLLSVKLYSRRSVRRKRYLGQVHLGFDSPTQEAAEQWRDSMSHPEKVIAVWHRLNGS
ncbi:tandem C2 domains nuclear protein [Coregonus clupeaformis]|uniref:tandem C2 domains nuclear protein n=1 Tax=Coregonus clupeaformis TaxID=59861 RepID=UPI001BE0AE0A|nr:tandem C2 domains nuclear protein [Coregonus clupeaformis]